MALENGLALTRVRVPYADAGVETPGCNPSAIKSDGIDLAEMA